jgi:plasmid stability protein
MVQVNIPDDLYQRLKLRAAATLRTIEEQVVKTLEAGLYMEESDLPPEFAATLAALEASDDIELLRIAATPYSPRMTAALQEMRERQQRPDISDAEKRKIAEILYQYDMKELLRSKAEALLKQREGNVH